VNALFESVLGQLFQIAATLLALSCTDSPYQVKI